MVKVERTEAWSPLRIEPNFYNGTIKGIVTERDGKKLQSTQRDGTMLDFIVIEVEIDGQKTEKGEPVIIGYPTSMKFSEKSKLGAVWQSVMGTLPPLGEEANLDMLIGKKVRVIVKDREKSRDFQGKVQVSTISVIDEITAIQAVKRSGK